MLRDVHNQLILREDLDAHLRARLADGRARQGRQRLLHHQDRLLDLPLVHLLRQDPDRLHAHALVLVGEEDD